MKVLQEPNENENLWKGEFTCTGHGWDQGNRVPCGRLLEVSATDLQYRHYTDMMQVTETFYGFTCCKCGCFTEIDRKLLPFGVTKFAKEYKSPDKND